MTQLTDIRLTVLVDNSSGIQGLKAEHGFSCLVEADGYRVLFDTGANNALRENSRYLGVELRGLDALVFSHGHYDHTGGLAAVAQELEVARVLAHPNILGSHRSQRTGRDRDIGMPEAARIALQQRRCDFERGPIEVIGGIWTTGEIPRRTLSAKQGELFVDSAGSVPDTVPDDIALVLRHHAGLIVLIGCAHAGVLDTLAWIDHLFPDEPLLGVLGGMHLDGATAETTEAVVQSLREGIPFVAPGHCTGAVATTALLDALGSRGHALHVGMQIEVHRSGQFELKDPCPI